MLKCPFDISDLLPSDSFKIAEPKIIEHCFTRSSASINEHVPIREGQGYVTFSWREWVLLLKFAPTGVRLGDSKLQEFVCELYGYENGKYSTQG